MQESAKHDPRLALHPRARQHMTEQIASWFTDEDRVVVVAEEGGRVVIGFVAARLIDGNGWQAPERLAEISDCYVVAPRRRRGIGRRLVGRAMDLVFEKGVNTLTLQSAARNPEATAFWETLGWTPQESILEREAGE